MPANKRPRKKFNPRSQELRARSKAHAQAGRRPLAEGSVRHIQTGNHVALQSLLNGTGNEGDWAEVATALHIASVIDRAHYAAEFAEEIGAAIEAHAQCGARMVSKGRAVYTGPEMLAVRRAFEVHDVQVQQATLQEMERTIATYRRESENPNHPACAANRLRAILAAEAHP